MDNSQAATANEQNAVSPDDGEAQETKGEEAGIVTDQLNPRST